MYVNYKIRQCDQTILSNPSTLFVCLVFCGYTFTSKIMWFPLLDKKSRFMNNKFIVIWEKGAYNDKKKSVLDEFHPINCSNIALHLANYRGPLCVV